MFVHKTVSVPLSKLHFELLDDHGNKINMGDGVRTKQHMFQAWTDEIHPLMVKSIEFPKLDYSEYQPKEPYALLHLQYDDEFDYSTWGK